MTDALTRSAADMLRSAGRRITPERELLLRIVARNAHLDAGEIHRLARSEMPRIGLATVYRTLSLFRELGVVKSSEFGEDHRHFEVRRDDHVHLVCSDCGRVLDIRTPGYLRRLAERNGFDVSSVRIEASGRCADCRARSHRSPALGQ